MVSEHVGLKQIPIVVWALKTTLKAWDVVQLVDFLLGVHKPGFHPSTAETRCDDVPIIPALRRGARGQRGRQEF